MKKFEDLKEGDKIYHFEITGIHVLTIKHIKTINYRTYVQYLEFVYDEVLEFESRASFHLKNSVNIYATTLNQLKTVLTTLDITL